MSQRIVSRLPHEKNALFDEEVRISFVYFVKVRRRFQLQI